MFFAVCDKVVSEIHSKLSKSQLKQRLVVEEAIDTYCSKTQKDSKEKKLCYFIQPIKRDISTPIGNGVPPNRICKRLKKRAQEICTIRYPEKIDLSKVDLSKLRVRQLRKILSENGVACDNCIEKADFIREVKRALGQKEEL